jgi:hypothetical protein
VERLSLIIGELVNKISEMSDSEINEMLNGLSELDYKRLKRLVHGKRKEG